MAIAVIGINIVIRVINNIVLRKGISRIANTNPATTQDRTEIVSAEKVKSKEFFNQAIAIPFWFMKRNLKEAT
jgi:hypothetical protein